MLVLQARLIRSLCVPLNWKAKLLIYWLVYVLNLSHGRKVWIVTERKRLWIQVAKISFLCMVTRLGLEDRNSEFL